MSVCHEPGCHTIFQEASPTFKKRFMYMSGITDEDEFDAFRKKITWEGHATRSRCRICASPAKRRTPEPAGHSERLNGGAQGAEADGGLSGSRATRSATFRPPISARSRRSCSPTGSPIASPANALCQRALVRHRLGRNQQDAVLNGLRAASWNFRADVSAPRGGRRRLPTVALAETYPSRPVRMIVGLPPANSPDIIARLIGGWLSEQLGQPFVVENRPGAATNIATELVVRAAA